MHKIFKGRMNRRPSPFFESSWSCSLRVVLFAFQIILCAALPGLGRAQSTNPFPDQNFFTSELYFPVGPEPSFPDVPDTNAFDGEFTVDEFVGRLKVGVWEQDTDTPGAWIYRITSVDQLTGQTHVLALLFQPSENVQNSILLSRAVSDQVDIPRESIRQSFQQEFSAAEADAAPLSIDDQPPPDFPVPTRFGVLSVDASTKLLLIDGKPISPSVVGNNSLDYVRILQEGESDVVIAQDTGGSACPAMYYVVTVSASGATASGEFGNCQLASSINIQNAYAGYNRVDLKAGEDDFLVDSEGVRKNGLWIAQPAVAAPLTTTDLYAKITHDCHSINLSKWQHPTRTVMQNAGVKIVKVELCNDGKYPIFTVGFKYDPEGLTDDYFEPLYASVAQANGFWPYSFVDIDDSIIIDVGVDKTKKIPTLTVNFEKVDPTPASTSPP